MLLGKAVGGLTGSFAQVTGQFTDLQSRLQLTVGGASAATEAMGRLQSMARRTYSDFAGTTESFLGMSGALKELGYRTNEQLDFVESLNNALVVSGAKAERAAQVQDALGKAMALGTLQGDQLNTVISVGGRVAELLAEQLGVGVNQLRALGSQGKITGDIIYQALAGNLEKVRQEAEAMPATIQDGVLLLGDAVKQTTADIDGIVGASAATAAALVGLADGVKTVGQALKDNQGTIKTVLGALGGAATAYGILAVGRALAGAGGVAASIGVVRTAFLALTAAMAANPVGLALLGIGALTGVAIAYDNAPQGADRIAKEIDYQTQRIEKAEAQLAAAGGSRGGKDPLTAKLEARIEAMKRYRSELQNQAMQAAPGAAGAGGGRGSINPPTVGEMQTQAKAAQQAWQASIAGVKTASSIHSEYNEKLKASRAALADMRTKGVAGQELANAIAKQQEFEAALTDGRDKALKSLEASAAQGAKTLALQGKLTLDEVRQSTEAMLATYQGADNILQARRSAGLLDEQEYTQAKLSLIELERDARIAALEQENTLLAAQKSSGHDALAQQRQMAANRAQIARISADAAVQAQVLHIQGEAAADAEAGALKNLTATHQRYMQQLEQQQQRQLQTAYLSSRDKEHLQGQWAIEDKYLAEERRLADQRMLASNLSAAQEREIARRLANLQAEKERELAIHQQTYDQLAAMRGQWGNGLQMALAEYGASAADVAAQSAQAFTTLFKGMEDAAVQFALTGKASVSDMARSIIADLIRIQVRAALVGGNGQGGLLGSLLSAGLSFFSGGASTGTASGQYSLTTASNYNGGGTGLKLNALGGIYDSPSLSQYRNQIHDTPKFFAFAKGAGVFGEAGPEAIMPLTRAANGSLGVRAVGMGGSAASNIKVEIINSGQPMQVERTEVSQDADGQVVLKAFLAEAVKQSVQAVAAQTAGDYGDMGRAMRARKAMGV